MKYDKKHFTFFCFRLKIYQNILILTEVVAMFSRMILF